MSQNAKTPNFAGLGTGFSWAHRNVRVQGYSLAGVSTSLLFPEAGACFDVAQGLPYQVPIPNILISHGHMDHAAGLPYLIGQKSMTGQIPPKIYMPPSLIKPMREIMRLWGEIEDHTYQYQFIAPELGVDYPLDAPYFFRIFPTFHRVPSQGYTIFERKKRLKEIYKSLDPRQLAELRKKGEAIEDHFAEPILSFTGDSTIEFLDSEYAPLNSRVLMMEVTYWDAKKSVANAREWGHIHLDELIPRLEQIKCEKVVLIHASARYGSPQLREILEARIPEQFKSRVEIFPRAL